MLGRGRQALTSGQSAGVRAIGASGSDVVAGGTFTNVGGIDRRNLAAIDLTTGQPATAFNPPMNGQFSALASVNSLALTDDGLVWAGGEFVTEGPTERISLAAFDAVDRRDRQLPPGPERRLGGISALAATGSTVYAGGSFTIGRQRPQAQPGGLQERPR